MRRTLIIQLLLFSLSHLSFAQGQREVSGVVYHKTMPLAGVELSIVGNSGNVVTVSDSNGAFRLSVNEGSDLVRFNLEGYYTQDIRLKDSFTSVYLLQKVNLLDQIVVSENKTEKSLKRTTVTMDLIQPELIEETAPTRVQESINRINGVQIVDGQANIRSGSGWSYGAGSRVQVLLNGVPMLSGDAAQAQWSFIPTEGIENIEVIKGASSVIYGSSALNGVINVKTKTHAEKPMTFLSFSTGVYDLADREGLDFNSGNRNNVSNLSAFHVGKINTMDYTLGINMLHDAGYKMNDDEQRARTTFGLRKAIPDKNVVLGLESSFQMGNSSSFLLWESYELGYTSLDSGNTESRSTKLRIDPYIKWTKGGFNQQFNIRYLKVSNSVDNGDTSVDQSNYSDLVYGEYQLKRKIKEIQLIGGLVAQWSETRSPIFNGLQHTNNAAAYVQAERQWKKLLINAGVRYERYQLNKRMESKPVMRAGLNYELTRSSFLRLSYGQGFRFPSVAETYVTTTVGPVSVYPNPELGSEQGYSWEVGIKQAYKIKAIEGFIDLAYFDMRFEGMTEFLFAQWNEFKSFDELGAGFKAVNAGRTKINGFELSTGFRARTRFGRFQGFLGYNNVKAVSLDPDMVIATNFYGDELTYSNTSTVKRDNILKYRPSHSLKGDIMYSYSGFSLSYGLNWQSAMENIDTAFVSPPIDFFVPGVQTSLDKELSKRLLQNIRIGYAVNKRLNINLIISNFQNVEHMIRPADLGAPRSYRFQIRYTFNE